jgi:hypothetical protein
MAKPDRPTAVFVIAVLNFIFGSLRLLNGLCGGLIILGMVALFNFLIGEMRKKNAADAKEFEDALSVFTNIPGLVPFLIASLLISIILGVVMIVLGFGLLRMRRWAHGASIVYAIVAILLALGEGGYSMVVVSPAVMKANSEFQEKLAKQVQAKGRPAPPPNPFASNPMFNMFGAAIGVIVGCIYPIAVLVIMFLPNVRAAFARAGPGGDKYASPKHREDDAADFERRGYGDSEY